MATGTTEVKDVIVVDMGSKPKKQIKRLRKGEGKLMDKVKECLAELKTSGAITGGVQPVVIVIKEKPSMGGFMGMM